MIKITKFSVAFIGALAFIYPANAQIPDINATPRIVIPAPAKRPSPNGFDLYARAAKSIIPAEPAVDEVNDGKPPTDPKVRARQYSLRRKKRWLRQNARALALFQSAMKVPTFHPAAREFGDFLPDGFALREMARVKTIEANARRLSGDWNGAMQSRLDTVQMGNDIARGGVLISALVCFNIQATGYRGVWLEIENLDATQARQSAKRLGEISARRISQVETLRAEKTFGQTESLKQMREPQWRNVNRWAEENLFNEMPTWTDRLKLATVSKQAVMDNYSQIMDAMIANAQLPYAAPQTPIPVSDNPFTRNSVSTIHVSWVFARNDAANALWLVALALQAHKLERGSYPTSLRVLEGAYLKSIPADAFGGGEKLRYKRAGDSYVLWSVGPDKRDNNGTPIPHEKNVSPEQRRKPARVNPESRGDYMWGRNQ